MSLPAAERAFAADPQPGPARALLAAAGRTRAPAAARLLDLLDGPPRARRWWGIVAACEALPADALRPALWRACEVLLRPWPEARRALAPRHWLGDGTSLPAPLFRALYAQEDLPPPEALAARLADLPALTIADIDLQGDIGRAMVVAEALPEGLRELELAGLMSAWSLPEALSRRPWPRLEALTLRALLNPEQLRDLAELPARPHLERLDLGETRLTEAPGAAIAGLFGRDWPRLKELDLPRVGDDAGWLAGVPALEALRLHAPLGATPLRALVARLAERPALRRLELPWEASGALPALAQSPLAGRLRELALGLRLDEAGALAAMPELRRLELTLAPPAPGPSCRALVAAVAAAGLRELASLRLLRVTGSGLELARGGPGAEEVEALARACPGLEELALPDCGVSASGAAAIAAAPWSLRRLDLSYSALSAAALIALISGLRGRLVELRIAGAKLSPGELAALTELPALAEVEELHLDECGLDGRHLEVLARARWPRLRRLSLLAQPLREEEVDALWEGPQLEDLGTIEHDEALDLPV